MCKVARPRLVERGGGSGRDAQRTMVLPPPTGEQEGALALWVEGASQVVSAAAGSGKSTLLLHAVQRAPTGARVVVLSYNRPLAVEMTAKLEDLEYAGAMRDGVTAQALTFHGLCSNLFALTPDDTTMEATLDAVERGSLRPAVAFHPTHVCIDEVQDMRPLHHRLLRAVLPAGCVFLLVGDANQLLYDFEVPPATTAFMDRPEAFFAGAKGGKAPWRTSRLSVSFRLTPPVAALANAVAEQDGLATLAAGSALANPPFPRVVTCSVWQWTQKLLPLVLEAFAEAESPSQVAILARTVRASQPLLAFVNVLAAHNVPVYVHSCDGADPRVREGKLCVSTWHAAKGLQWLHTFVVGVEASSEPRPLHVALTRAQKRLVVVHDARAPHGGLLRALWQAKGEVSVDSDTARMLAAPPPGPVAGWCGGGGGAGPRDVSNFAPRGALAHHLHHLVVDVGGLPPGATRLPSEQVVELDSMWEDVTDIFVDGALMEVERRRTGRCLRVEEMCDPVRAPRADRLERLMSGDRRRVVDARLRDRDLVPSLARYVLKNFAHDANPASRAEQALHAAAGASAYAGFHHRANRLVASRWWDGDLFSLTVAMLHEALPEDATFDAVRARRPALPGERPLYARAQACTPRCAYRFVFGDRLTAADRLRAVVPMALDPSVEMCTLLNLRTGECQRLVLSDRAAFLSGVHSS